MGDIEKYIAAYNKEHDSLVSNYNQKNEKAEAEAEELLAELFYADSAKEADKIGEKIEKLEAEVDSSRDEIENLENYDIRLYRDEVIEAAKTVHQLEGRKHGKLLTGFLPGLAILHVLHSMQAVSLTLIQSRKRTEAEAV